jgi:spore photoproduct lyase
MQDREYYLLHAANCPFDCSYCYLQNYFSNAVPTIFVDTDTLFEQVKTILRDAPEKEVLFHAGQTADALALEHFSGFASEAVPFFSKLDNAILELRTKSDLIESLLPLRHNRRTVVSWTLTPDEISRQYEKGAASIAERLQAALQCQSAGYPIGLRFDPLIHYSDWRAGYGKLVNSIFSVLSPEAIDSIVLGTFRCQPPLLDLMRERFGRMELTLGEFVPAPDGKMRYFRRIREQMFRELIDLLCKRCGQSIRPKIELSMEPEYIWSGVGLF